MPEEVAAFPVNETPLTFFHLLLLLPILCVLSIEGKISPSISTLPFLSIVKTFLFLFAVPKANLTSLVSDAVFKSIFALEPNKTKLSLSIGFRALALTSKLSSICFLIELF